MGISYAGLSIELFSKIYLMKSLDAVEALALIFWNKDKIAEHLYLLS